MFAYSTSSFTGSTLSVRSFSSDTTISNAFYNIPQSHVRGRLQAKQSKKRNNLSSKRSSKRAPLRAHPPIPRQMSLFRNFFGGGQPEDDEDNGAEYVETLVERVETCSAPEDRRDALRALRGVAKKYRLAVGTMGMDSYIDILDKDRLNSETMTLVLDTMATVLSADDDSSESDELGERLAEVMIKRKGFIPSVLAAVDQFDFGVRRTSVQLLSNLLRHRGTEVQNAVLQQPAGLSKLVDIIHDNREVIRNEAILMICELSRANSQIQQLLAYDNIFNDLLNIIETEPLDSKHCHRRLSFRHAQLVAEKLNEERASDAESLIDMIAAKSIGSCPSESGMDRIQVADIASEESYSVVDESIEKMKQLRIKTLSSPDSSSTKLEMKMLPAMSQIQFIQLWKTFYDMLSGKETEQSVFHSLAVTGTLLLQLGETHRELQAKLEAQIADAMQDLDETIKVPEDGDNIDEFEEDRKIDPIEVQRKRIGDMQTCMADDEWRVNLEQILASIMAEATLSDFFEKKYSLDGLIKKYYKTRFSEDSIN